MSSMDFSTGRVSLGAKGSGLELLLDFRRICSSSTCCPIFAC